MEVAQQDKKRNIANKERLGFSSAESQVSRAARQPQVAAAQEVILYRGAGDFGVSHFCYLFSEKAGLSEVDLLEVERWFLSV